MFVCLCIYASNKLIKKETMNFKESKEGYMRGFGKWEWGNNVTIL